MQSLARQFKRGNAVIYFDSVTKNTEVQQKRGTTAAQWNHCVRMASEEAMDAYCTGVTKPITKAMMDEAKANGKRMVINN